MKKVLTIALALLFVMTAVSSFAIVAGSDISGKKLQFDSISISTDKALVDYAVTSVSAIADPAGTYVGDQLIFGYLKFTLDQNRPDDLGFDDDIVVHLTSDYATFPKYLNTAMSVNGPAIFAANPLSGGYDWYRARTHFLDKNGVLQPIPYSFVSNGTARTIGDFAYIRGDSDENEFIVGVPAFDAVGLLYTEAYMRLLGSMPNQPLTKVNDKISTSLYVGFNAIVKDSTSTQGTIKAYIASGGTSKFKLSQYAIHGGLFGDAGANVLYIDKYKDGKPVYRVYKLTNGFTLAPATEGNQGYEYLVQPYEDEDTLTKWAVGFQNAAMQTGTTLAKYFGKFTYREGLNTNPDKILAADPGPTMFTANFEPDVAGASRITSILDNAWDTLVFAPTVDGAATALPDDDLAVNQLYGSGAMKARASDSGKYYKFFKVVEGGADLDKQFVDKNELDSKVDPIMEYFGFSYNYLNATNDSHYTSGGWKEYKEATFNYFGASIPTDDDDVIPAETGDASTTIVIVLAASALLAAAALFFVMKKARD